MAQGGIEGIHPLFIEQFDLVIPVYPINIQILLKS